jgi:hypothetical protein
MTHGVVDLLHSLLTTLPYVQFLSHDCFFGHHGFLRGLLQLNGALAQQIARASRRSRLIHRAPFDIYMLLP